MRAALSSVSPPAPECAASEAPPPCLPSSPSAAPVALPPRAFAPEPAMPPPACVAPGHPRGGHIPAGSSHLRPSSQAARQPDQPREPHGTQSAPRRYHALQNPTGPPHTPLPRATHGIMQPNRTEGGADARSQPASARAPTATSQQAPAHRPRADRPPQVQRHHLRPLHRARGRRLTWSTPTTTCEPPRTASSTR